MSYASVDQLQRTLAQNVFHYTKDAKKAAGRALGTLVEIITFYLLKSWGLESSITIERPLAEYGNPAITHNVEFSIHPTVRTRILVMPPDLPITATKIINALGKETEFSIESREKTPRTLLTTDNIRRNSCVIAAGRDSYLVATLGERTPNYIEVNVVEQYAQPFAIVECKRVGVEEGMAKGPQTIEKAKQGAYVARSVSSLHKIRMPSGELEGLVFRNDQSVYIKPYQELLTEIIHTTDVALLKAFILTIGVVSNHGNWFTSDDHNKELKVLAQSYDWLLFLTDAGLSECITELLLAPAPSFIPIRNAFLASYSPDKTKNRFTKVQMDYQADQLLLAYFTENLSRIENWFNIITPQAVDIHTLRAHITQLKNNDWRMVHTL